MIATRNPGRAARAEFAARRVREAGTVGEGHFVRGPGSTAEAKGHPQEGGGVGDGRRRAGGGGQGARGAATGRRDEARAERGRWTGAVARDAAARGGR